MTAGSDTQWPTSEKSVTQITVQKLDYPWNWYRTPETGGKVVWALL